MDKMIKIRTLFHYIGLTDRILPPISVPIPKGDPRIASSAPSPPLLPPLESACR